MFSPIRWFEAIRDAGKKESFYSQNDPALAKALDEFGGKVRSWRLRGIALIVVLAILAAGSLWGVYSYVESRYYLGVQNGKVAIYQGIKESFGGIGFSHLYLESEVSLSDLPDFQQDLILNSISADSLEDAKAKLEKISESVNNG
jgi:protein phosphatase